MADITKCVGHNCPIKMTCHRYTAVESEHWQAWSDFTAGLNANECAYFWDNTGLRKDLRFETIQASGESEQV